MTLNAKDQNLFLTHNRHITDILSVTTKEGQQEAAFAVGGGGGVWGYWFIFPY